MYKALNTGAIGVAGGLTRVVELGGKFGFQGVYFNPAEVVRMGIARAKTLFDNHYVKPAGFGLPVNFRRDEDQFREDLAGLAPLAQVAAELGCRRCSTWLSPASNDLPFKENFELHRRRLTQVAKVLARYNIRFGLEFVGPKTSRAGKKHEFIHTADGMLELCKAIGTGNVGLLLDCWHWYTSGGTVGDFAGWTKETIVDVHVNDAPKGIPVDQQRDGVRCLPGETGVIDIKGFLQGLHKLGYDGPVMAEPFSKRVREMKAEDAVRTTKESLDKIWQIAGLPSAK
jgi:sugar phosphate isomerase/epimerase